MRRPGRDLRDPKGEGRSRRRKKERVGERLLGGEGRRVRGGGLLRVGGEARKVLGARGNCVPVKKMSREDVWDERRVEWLEGMVWVSRREGKNRH